MKSAVARLHATGMWHTTATRSSAFTSGSCGWIRASHHRAGRSGSVGVTPGGPDVIPRRAAGLPGRGPGYRVPGPASGPTCVPSHLLSGRVVRRKPATLPRAAAVSSQGSTGHWFQATTPLYRSRPIRG